MKNEKNIAVMFSLRPKWTMLIANNDKTIEVRSSFCYEWAKEQIKKFGGFYGYIYCTKGKPYVYRYRGACREEYAYSNRKIGGTFNGKVVGRFWCDNVEHFEFETLSRDMDGYWWDNGKSLDRDFLKKS